jgi:hypothetical protein
VTAAGIRLAGLAGVASFTLIIVAALVSPPLWDAPDSAASGEEIVEYVGENRGRIIAGLFIYSLGMGLFLVLAAGLWTWFRAQRSSEVLSATFALGAIAMATLIFAGFGSGGAGAYRLHGTGLADALKEPELAQALYDMTFYLLALSGIPTAVCMGAYGALVLKGAGLPAWTAWLAILGAAAHILIAASLLFESGVMSLQGEVIVLVPATLFAWILAAGASLLRVNNPPPD